MNTANEKLKISINPARVVNEEEMYAALTETERDFFHAGAWSSVAEAYQEAKIRRPLDFMSKKMPVDPIDWRLAQCAPLIQAGKASIEQVLCLSSTTLKNMLPLLLSSQLVTIDSVLVSEALHINSPHYSYFILILFNILSTEQLNAFSQEDAWLSRQIMFLLFNRLITPSELPHYIKDSKLIRAYMSISQEELDILILKCFNMADSLPSFISLAADKKDEMVHALLAMTSDNEMSAWYVAQFEMSPPLKRGGNAAVDDRSLSHPPATTSEKRAAKAAAVTDPHSPTRFASVATQDAHHHDSHLSRQDMYDALTPLERELLACGVWSSIQQAYDDVKLNRPDDFRVTAKPTNTMEARLERFTHWILTGKITTEHVLSLSDKSAHMMLTMLRDSRMVSIESIIASDQLQQHPHHVAYSLLILFNLISPEQLHAFSHEEWVLSQKIMCLLMNRLLKPSELPHYLGNLPLVMLYASIPDEELSLLYTFYFNDKPHLSFIQYFDGPKKEIAIRQILAIKTAHQLTDWHEAQCLRLDRLQGIYGATEDEPGLSPEVWRAAYQATSTAIAVSASASAEIMDATADDRPLPRLNVTPCSSPTLFAALVAPAESEGANEQHQNSSFYPGYHSSSST